MSVAKKDIRKTKHWHYRKNRLAIQKRSRKINRGR